MTYILKTKARLSDEGRRRILTAESLVRLEGVQILTDLFGTVTAVDKAGVVTSVEGALTLSSARVGPASQPGKAITKRRLRATYFKKAWALAREARRVRGLDSMISKVRAVGESGVGSLFKRHSTTLVALALMATRDTPPHMVEPSFRHILASHKSRSGAYKPIYRTRRDMSGLLGIYGQGWVEEMEEAGVPEGEWFLEFLRNACRLGQVGVRDRVSVVVSRGWGGRGVLDDCQLSDGQKLICVRRFLTGARFPAALRCRGDLMRAGLEEVLAIGGSVRWQEEVEKLGVKAWRAEVEGRAAKAGELLRWIRGRITEESVNSTAVRAGKKLSVAFEPVPEVEVPGSRNPFTGAMVPGRTKLDIPSGYRDITDTWFSLVKTRIKKTAFAESASWGSLVAKLEELAKFNTDSSALSYDERVLVPPKRLERRLLVNEEFYQAAITSLLVYRNRTREEVKEIEEGIRAFARQERQERPTAFPFKLPTGELLLVSTSQDLG